MKTPKSHDETGSPEEAAAQPGRRTALQAFLGAAAAVGTLTQSAPRRQRTRPRQATWPCWTRWPSSRPSLDAAAADLSRWADLPDRDRPLPHHQRSRFRSPGHPTQRRPGHLLTKVMAPPIPVNKIGQIDLALVSHAQHLDNLDNEGRRLLEKVGMTLTTPASAAMKLPGKDVRGLATWQSIEIKNAAGRTTEDHGHARGAHQQSGAARHRRRGHRLHARVGRPDSPGPSTSPAIPSGSTRSTRSRSATRSAPRSCISARPTCPPSVTTS